MSNTRTLVYKEASVSGMRQDLDTLRTGPRKQLQAVFESVDRDLVAWSQVTVSRQAERQYQRDLRESIRRALEALEKLSTALHDAGSWLTGPRLATSLSPPEPTPWHGPRADLTRRGRRRSVWMKRNSFVLSRPTGRHTP